MEEDIEVFKDAIIYNDEDFSCIWKDRPKTFNGHNKSETSSILEDASKMLEDASYELIKDYDSHNTNKIKIIDECFEYARNKYPGYSWDTATV